MYLRYLIAAALTLACLWGGQACAKPSHHHTRPHRIAALPPAIQLYSQRALRRARTILQLKLLELRSERLERVRRAVEQRLPVDELLKI